MRSALLMLVLVFLALSAGAYAAVNYMVITGCDRMEGGR